MKSNINLATSTAVYENAPKSREMIMVSWETSSRSKNERVFDYMKVYWLCFNFDFLQAEKEYDDYEKLMIDRKRGVKHHLLTGHGPTQETFEKRDFKLNFKSFTS